MQNPVAIILFAALLASGLFLTIVNAGLGFLFVFLPSLPLFLVGFAFSPQMALRAGLVAVFPIALLTGSLFPPALFLFSFSIPCWFICYLLCQYHDIQLNNNTNDKLPILRLWYPVGLITLYLALYGCIILAFATAFYAMTDVNLPHQLAQEIQSQISEMQKEYDIVLDVTPADLSFMLCSFFVWLWAIALWGHAWIANYVLVRKKMASRPNLSISPFPFPNWLLTLMSICALASLIGGESMRFLGKTSLIILLLPYFFQGAAILHLNLRNWAYRRFFLFFMYFSIATLFWPAFVLSGIGLWYHVKMLNKHLSSGGNSPIS